MRPAVAWVDHARTDRLEATRAAFDEAITLRQAKKLIQCMAHEQSFLLLSAPGMGKSEMVYEAAREAGLPCRSLLGTPIAPEDVSGVPRIVGERSVFCPPRILLPERAEPLCLFLDELQTCAPDVQKAFYSLLLERRLGEHALPPGTGVVAAGNRLQDRALVRAMAPRSSIASRYCNCASTPPNGSPGRSVPASGTKSAASLPPFLTP